MSQSVFNTKVFEILSNDKNISNKDRKLAGVAVPIFSLKSGNSFGIGDFSDLKTFANWCHKVGLRIIQILPINDTRTDDSWNNSYPYKAISTKALHPIYLDIKKLGILKNTDDRHYFEKQKEILNSKDFVDYPEVMKVKDVYFRKIFAQTWNGIKNSDDYKSFFMKNEDWLVPYAAFCALCKKFGTSDFSLWKEYSTFKKDLIAQISSDESIKSDIEFHCFLQYHLDKQLKEAVDYLHLRGVALKGDIPIGIGRNSVEAWTSPELFNLDSQAGAPPDAFATEGQNWGFPTYNWEMMAQDNYEWWRNRLSHMSQYFDAYRIDHILGFFRIWEIPYEHTQGIMGHFSPALGYQPSAVSHQLSASYERLTKPYVRGHFLHDFFGEFTEEAREKYLNETSFSYFELKQEYDTQRKINDYFDNRLRTTDYGLQARSEKDEKIKNGLIALCSEVLFVKDTNDQLHPRIALQFTHSYNELNDSQKNIINNLYDDYFYHRNEKLWKEEALKKLPKIIESSNNMLVCGEDLGMVPACVPDVMKQLNILSLEVQRMPKNIGTEFINPKDNQYLSVDTTSTHDTSTLRGWWEENGQATNRFYREILGHNEGAPFFAEPWICKEIVKQHLESSSLLTILPIQDYIAIDGNLRWNETQREQINVPANPNHHWCYKMHQSLESLNERQDFNDMLKDLIKDSGRF